MIILKSKKEANGLAEEFGFENLRFHSANSASLMRHVDFEEDMARVGIAAYGCMNLPAALHVKGFKPVLSLYANKISSRELKKVRKSAMAALTQQRKISLSAIMTLDMETGF